MADAAQLSQKAKAIIDAIEYIDLATVTPDGHPWSSPLWYVRDDEYNFYFYSPKTSQHSQNIRTNGRGFVVIYDSRAPEGTGEGVYMTVMVRELTTETEIAGALTWVFAKKPKPKKVSDFMGDAPRRIYKVTPTAVWMNDAELKDGLYLDFRVPVSLA
jgi:nitroimidazol reductase NimA-like FMN-containing flavoprotein (pyridoxamine 5'-phosphate oxidase superfamily)